MELCAQIHVSVAQMILTLSLALTLAPQSQTPQEPTYQWVDTGFDMALFAIENPENAKSKALRINDDLASKAGLIPEPTPGYILTDTIIVETIDLGDLAAIANGTTESWVELMDGAPGFSLVHTASVSTAIDLLPVLDAVYGDNAAYLDAERPLALRALPTDPNFSNQWHLLNTLNPIADVNVEGAWNNGYTGTGVVVGIVDGGVETSHPDLNDNYNSTASQSGGNSSHGTSCAGVSSAEANNGRGGVGVAYDSNWAKLYYGGSSTNVAAFGHRNDINDIKSNSWGPFDNGTISYLTSSERSAFESAIATGRGGLGEVFAWAAGNGGTSDRVEYDPYASSRFTLAIGAIGDNDTRSYYNEHGSSMTVVAHSDGNNRGIYTTTSGQGYTSNFGGTSSASPLGAGVVALMLDANPALTWRDVQAVLIESARKNDGGNSNWLVNGAGYDVNINYGFGAVDADAATQLAATWTNLPAEQSSTSGVQTVNTTIPDNNTTGLTRTFTIPDDITIEAVELKMNVAHNYIGDLVISLVSPSGTNSILAKERNDSQNDYNNYILTTMRCWGESSSGTWTIKISDEDSGTTGTWENYTLTVYGHDGGGVGTTLTIAAPTFQGGASTSVAVTNGTASSTTWLAVSTTGTGSFSIPGLGITLNIANPIPLGGAQQTDGAGATNFLVSVPAGASGRAYWLQALQSGKVSNVLNGTVL